MIVAKGHDIEHDDQEGWIKCRRCTDGWWVAKRAEIADDPRIKMPLFGGAEHIDPFNIGVCQP